MNATGVRIAGCGHYAPERVLSNTDLEQILDTNDEWITSRTGMKRRHIAASHEACSDLALGAARDALRRAGLKPSDIDAYVVATCTPDYPFPATAAIVASKLEAGQKMAFDMEIACSGFLYGLVVTSSLVRTGVYKRVMLIGAEKLSAILDYTDRGTAILFGDGAGAVILEQSDSDAFLSSDLGSDAAKPELLWVPAGGSRTPMTPELLAERDFCIHMSGKEVFKFAVHKMTESAVTTLRRAHLEASDIAWLVPHQANKRIIDAAAKAIPVAPERVIVNIEEYGNTSAASIPIALSELDRSGKLKDGDIVMFAAFGGGLSWGAVAWRWGN